MMMTPPPQRKTGHWRKDIANRRKAALADRSRRLAPLGEGIKKTAALELSLLAEVTAKFVTHVRELIDKSSITDLDGHDDGQS